MGQTSSLPMGPDAACFIKGSSHDRLQATRLGAPERGCLPSRGFGVQGAASVVIKETRYRIGVADAVQPPGVLMAMRDQIVYENSSYSARGRSDWQKESKRMFITDPIAIPAVAGGDSLTVNPSLVSRGNLTHARIPMVVRAAFVVCKGY
jgi:hypothetical protein